RRLAGRRGVPRVPRGPAAPGRRGAHRGAGVRTPVVIGNWKMHGTVAEARVLAGAIRDAIRRPRGVQVVVCPPFTALAAVAEVLAGSPIQLGAQTCHHEPAGAHTGEIDEVINLKLRAAMAHGLTPVLCVGETAEERRQGFTFTTVEGQLRAGLAGVTAAQMEKVVLAYEPVWAIGTGVNATPTQAGEVHGYLRGLLSELASKEAAQSVRILYGGSVKPENVDTLVAEPEIDGALVGGASLNAPGFVAIVRKAARAGTAPKE